MKPYSKSGSHIQNVAQDDRVKRGQKNVRRKAARAARREAKADLVEEVQAEPQPDNLLAEWVKVIVKE